MAPLRRRTLLKYGASAGAAAILAPWMPHPSTADAATMRGLTKFVQHVPLPGAGMVVATPRSVSPSLTRYAFSERLISRQLHPELPATPVFAYDDGSGLGGQAGSFGMTLVAQTGVPLQIDYANELPETYPAWIPVDTRLTPRGARVRTMAHLHGGFVAARDDGNPAVTPDGFGFDDVQSVFYPNQAPQQPASLLWFHDHGLGATRLNVFAGLAGAYLIRDRYDTGDADNANHLPSGRYEIPLVIQDRQFNADGTFLYPRSTIPGVTWIGEYFGDVMLVNGKVWPYLKVEPRLYRLRILNACNARILNLDIGGGRMWQIGADGGMWTGPVPVRRVVLAPAERADVLVDFSHLAGQVTQLKNGPVPRGVSSPAPILNQVMEIRVGNTTSMAPTIATTLVGGRDADLPGPARRRFITLNEVDPETPGWRLTLNGASFADAPTETPVAGTVEDWYYINLTEDTHPMHPHLVTHQVIGRVPFDAEAYVKAAGVGENGVPGGLDPTSFATGPMLPAEASERGFKDTVMVNPATFTIIRARFDLPAGVTTSQRYVHHCHIVEHEDNDMMRPYDVTT